MGFFKSVFKSVANVVRGAGRVVRKTGTVAVKGLPTVLSIAKYVPGLSSVASIGSKLAGLATGAFGNKVQSAVRELSDSGLLGSDAGVSVPPFSPKSSTGRRLETVIYRRMRI